MTEPLAIQNRLPPPICHFFFIVFLLTILSSFFTNIFATTVEFSFGAGIRVPGTGISVGSTSIENDQRQYIEETPSHNPHRKRSHNTKEFLQMHNIVRLHHGEQPFKWNRTLARFARRLANQNKSTCEIRHSNGPYGENIFVGSGNDWTPEDAVKCWIEEQRYYNSDNNSCLPDKMCGHYTQIVWKNSVQLGCALVSCNGGGTFVTCNYDPPGNFIGESPFSPLPV